MIDMTELGPIITRALERGLISLPAPQKYKHVAKRTCITVSYKENPTEYMRQYRVLRVNKKK